MWMLIWSRYIGKKLIQRKVEKKITRFAVINLKCCLFASDTEWYKYIKRTRDIGTLKEIFGKLKVVNKEMVLKHLFLVVKLAKIAKINKSRDFHDHYKKINREYASLQEQHKLLGCQMTSRLLTLLSFNSMEHLDVCENVIKMLRLLYEGKEVPDKNMTSEKYNETRLSHNIIGCKQLASANSQRNIVYLRGSKIKIGKSSPSGNKNPNLGNRYKRKGEG